MQLARKAVGALQGTVDQRDPVRDMAAMQWRPVECQETQAGHSSKLGPTGSLPLTIIIIPSRCGGEKDKRLEAEQGTAAEPPGCITAAPGTPMCYHIVVA